MTSTDDCGCRTKKPSLFSHSTGRVVTAPNGHRELISETGDTGHLLYGPYELRLPGRYRVVFDLAATNSPFYRSKDAICAVVDVVSDDGRTRHAERELRLSELSEGSGPVTLDFVVTEACHLEYRVATTGRAGLRVGGAVRIVPLPGDGRLRSVASAAAPAPCYIGCATDPAFVGLTATMLASVEEYGCVPDAIILVADFDLSPIDRAVLRASAGRMGKAMRFVPVDRASPLIPVIPDHPFPFPLIGRFVLPKIIDTAEARLILIDSDMILTDSLRPLFDMHMNGHAVAAVRDPMSASELRARGREVDPTYFNAGLLVIDIPRWNAAGVSDVAMRRWAAYPERPQFLDQDALNDVIGDDWLRLDRCWNFFYAGESRQFAAEWYESAPVVHYAGAKPDLARDHPAVPLYDRQVERVSARTGWLGSIDQSADRSLISLLYEIFLGREPEAERVVQDRVGQTMWDCVVTVLRSDESSAAILAPLVSGHPFAPNLYRTPPVLSQRYWMADRLPLFRETADALPAMQSWRDLLDAVMADDCFREAATLPAATRHADDDATARAQVAAAR
ncbi:glycosyltransferase family 8 protein [Sphingomonas prati]|nr:glycosyltransferase [Sphingomonas prati]